MIISNAKFLLGVTEETKFPILNLPEIAFIGRSNVGKSSLINSIVMRKKLAKISAAPGKTREINFFSVEDKWILVDMPGLGYATIGKAHRERWATLNYAYLEKREPLKFVCVLIDSRHDPMDKDIELIEFLEGIGKEYLIVLTKCDKISKNVIEERKIQLEHITSLCEHCLEVLPYSSVTDLGRNEMLGIIKKMTI
ncbi:MAG: ribosome biogenesis GTP-binding protein YihA/YsxC [Ignavibacteria bacterium]|jgi:GTP-binding protein|nr:ribosome biogenesis GTP-binding protein YihA/YsxC [Ignavibacteria bacterium]